MLLVKIEAFYPNKQNIVFYLYIQYKIKVEIRTTIIRIFYIEMILQTQKVVIYLYRL